MAAALVHQLLVVPELDDVERRLREIPRSPNDTAEALEAARALAKENPAAVANIVRGWVSGESA